MIVNAFFDNTTFTITYIVFDRKTHDAIVIDPVMDYDPKSSSYSTKSLSKLVEFIRQKDLNVHYLLETHAHADHLSGGQELKKIFPHSKVTIGRKIQTVQKTFKKIFNLGEDFKTDGSQFDLLLDDGDEFKAGPLVFKALHTPGHTPACYSYKIDNTIFTGDVLFMPDSGVARCDFPQGDAGLLFESVTRKLYRLPDETKIFTAHDYQPGGRELRYQSTISESKRSNIHINSHTKKEDFIKFRNQRDRALATPRLFYQSIQININGSHLPPAENNRVSYLKIPIKPA